MNQDGNQRPKGADDTASAATVIAPASATHVTAVSSPLSGAVPSSVGGNELLAGRYQILGLVGAGGMGSVYKAKDLELEETIALKALRRELVDTPGILERFRREVKLARRVTHHNVARVFDIGEHAGEKFLTMEYVDGESLACLLGREGALSIGRAVAIATDICAGLAVAHAAGVVHRDLKPDNVLVGKDGRIVVTDFGIARALVDDNSGTNTVGVFLGTPVYMAPEQVECAKDIDARADIYALGALLFEMFTGARPFTGDSPISIAAARLLRPPPDPRSKRPDLPTACAEVILRCMAKNRDDRFARATEVSEQLAQVTLPALISARTPTPTPRHSIPVPAERPNDKTVAVLPLKNSGPADDEYLAEELTDDLIDTLSMTPRLKVRSRGVVLPFRGETRDPRELGKELSVQVVIEGSVRRASGRVRISVRMTSVQDGFQLWAKRFDRPEADVLTINDEVARAVAEALTVDGGSPAREAPSDPVVVDLYLRARHEYRKFWPEALRKAIALFDEALVRAPTDPMLLSGKAMARSRLAFFDGAGFEEALIAAERAVLAAPELGEAHLALANAAFQVGDTIRTIRELKTAIVKNPALAEAHVSLGRVLIEIAEVEDGMKRLEAAIQLDPSVPLAYGTLARAKALLGDWDGVDELIDKSRATEGPTGSWTTRARMVLWRRDRSLAEKLLEEVVDKERYIGVPRSLLELAANLKLPVAGIEFLNLATQPSGGPRRQIFFCQLEAEAFAYLNQDERTLGSIAKAVEAGLIDQLWFDRCPLFSESVRTSPAYLALRPLLAARVATLREAYRSH